MIPNLSARGALAQCLSGSAACRGWSVGSVVGGTQSVLWGEEVRERFNARTSTSPGTSRTAPSPTPTTASGQAMCMFGDGLDAAVHKAFTRPAPKSAPAQMRYLVKQHKGTEAVAQMLRISQRTVERFVKGQIKKLRPGLAARLEREVKARW